MAMKITYNGNPQLEWFPYLFAQMVSLINKYEPNMIQDFPIFSK